MGCYCLALDWDSDPAATQLKQIEMYHRVFFLHGREVNYSTE